MARVYERLGSWVLPRELEDIGLENIPLYDPYEDDTQNEQTFAQLAEELEPMPEVRDYYIRAEILLPRGDEMARDNVVEWSCDARGNIMGRAHMNPILDTRIYQIEFAGGKVTESTANVITESMCAQYDADGNECLLLHVLLDYHKDNKAISQTDQQITVQGRSVTCKITAGWQICCQWKDGSTSWEKLSTLKKLIQCRQHEPTFNRET